MDLSITKTEICILRYIRDAGALTVRELQAQSNYTITNGTATGLLRRLMDKNVVKRDASDGDRSYKYSLTQPGNSALWSELDNLVPRAYVRDRK